MQRSPTTSDVKVSAAPQHFLQLNEGDPALAAEVGRVLCIALDQGHGAVAIARPEFLQLVEENLKDRGVDVAAVEKEGRYISRDATAELARIMVDDQPNSGLFTDVVDAIITPVYWRFERVSIFGEMVALLWDADNHQGAVRLERLWNSYIRNRPVLLYCAYPPAAAADPHHAEAFRDVCAEHCRVLSADSDIAFADM